MGIFFSAPQPINVFLHYAEPHKRTIPGFTSANDFTLQYTLTQGLNNVSTLLSMTQQHGFPGGNGIIGFSRQPNKSSDQMLSLDETVNNNETLFIIGI